MRGLARALWTRLAHATPSTADNHKGLSPVLGKQSTSVDLFTIRRTGVRDGYSQLYISGGYHNPSCTWTGFGSGVTSLLVREQGEGIVDQVRLDKAGQTISLLS
jgi:hypothetical protein